MKKIIFVLAVLVLAVPVFARVDITCAQVGDEPNVIVSYNNTEGQPVRAFALNITVDGGATITAVECLNSDYYIYPGSIDIDDGEVEEDGWGSCVCDPEDYDDTLPGLDSNGVTIEMASLYAATDPEHTTAPAASGQLLKLTLDGDSTACITIEGNVLRGKVVLEDATSLDPNALGCCAELGCACLGDISDTAGTGPPDTFVDIGDLNALLMAMFAQYPAGDGTGRYLLNPVPPGFECMDISDTAGTGPPDGFVDIGDLNALLMAMFGAYPAGDGTGRYLIPCQ